MLRMRKFTFTDKTELLVHLFHLHSINKPKRAMEISTPSLALVKYMVPSGNIC